MLFVPDDTISDGVEEAHASSISWSGLGYPIEIRRTGSYLFWRELLRSKSDDSKTHPKSLLGISQR